MSLDVFSAYVQGYSDRIHDQEALMVQAGYWSGYYMGAKHPKPLDTIIGMLNRARKGKAASQKHSDEVDVEAFEEMERKFNERRDSLGNK